MKFLKNPRGTFCVNNLLHREGMSFLADRTWHEFIQWDDFTKVIFAR